MLETEVKPRGRPRTNADEAPKLNAEGMNELEQVKKQLALFEDQIKQLTLDKMKEAPVKETEPQTKMSQKDIAESKDLYLKPNRCHFASEKFNEKFRDQWNEAKEYVFFIAENNECKGDAITLWTKKFPGVPMEEWIVPVNKPLWAPRYVAEQIKGAAYRQLKIDETAATGGQHALGYETGRITVESTIQRLDARPATKNRSIFMGTSGF